MGQLREHRSVLRFVAAFSRHDAALAWTQQTCAKAWGPIARASEVFEFSETTFYQQSMGTELKKILLVFEQLADPAELPDWKHQTNAWEQVFCESHDYPESRPLNIDPGYVTEAKLILASTKDRDHRIYLRRGIFAENTLFYQGGRWHNRPWTYPDYQRADYHEFLMECRAYLRRQYAAARRAASSA